MTTKFFMLSLHNRYCRCSLRCEKCFVWWKLYLFMHFYFLSWIWFIIADTAPFSARLSTFLLSFYIYYALWWFLHRNASILLPAVLPSASLFLLCTRPNHFSLASPVLTSSMSCLRCTNSISNQNQSMCVRNLYQQLWTFGYYLGTPWTMVVNNTETYADNNSLSHS